DTATGNAVVLGYEDVPHPRLAAPGPSRPSRPAALSRALGPRQRPRRAHRARDLGEAPLSLRRFQASSYVTPTRRVDREVHMTTPTMGEAMHYTKRPLIAAASAA